MYLSKENKRNIIIIIATLLVIGLVTGVYFSHKETSTIIVKRVDMQQVISKNSEGEMTTKFNYKVYSDHGVYEMEQSGLFARPEIISQINAGDTITVVARGYNIPLFDMYRVITEIK